MLRSFAWSGWAAGIFLALTVHICIASESDGPRRFQVRDSIEMATFADPGLISPDQRYIATLTERGRIEQNVTEATIWLFDALSVRRAINQPNQAVVAPEILVRMSALINGGSGVLGHGAVINRMVWEPGSDSLLFLGCSGNENRQLFRVRLSDHKLTTVSLPGQYVVDFTSAGNRIVYLAGPDVAPQKTWWSNDPSAPDIVGGGRSLWETLFPNYRKAQRYMPTEFEVWQTGDTPEPVIDSTTKKPMRLLGSYNLGAMGLSHDASQLVLVAHVDRVPKMWESYEVPKGLDHWAYLGTPDGMPVSLSDRENEYSWPLQYQLINLKNGTRRPLLEAPAADFQRDLVDQLQVSWSADDRAVAVTGTFLPLNIGTNGSKRPCGAAVIQMTDSRADCLMSHDNPKAGAVREIYWDEGHPSLLVQADRSDRFTYDGRSHIWKRSAGRSGVKSGALEPSVRQDLNTPPVLAITDSRSGKAREIFDPNPQLKEIPLGIVSVYTWKSERGLSATGGLAKPSDFVPGHRYPLVIQTHGFPSHQFFRVGYGSETANAGRALAGRGILVLQVREPHGPADGTWEEASQRGTEVYLAAVDKLAAEGLVDPNKVGITGYSRAGGFVAKAITEAPDRFAAAAVVNTDPGSQFGYYTYIDYDFRGNSQRIADFFGGSLPYGAGLQNWLKRAPGFNTEKITAPVLISAGDPQHLLSLWSLYAPLRDQNKPVELQYIRNGQHNLTKPLEVLAHQEMLVDWFDFWLTSHEDGGAAKADQYNRWHKLRDAVRPVR